MENHHFSMGKSTISMAIFNSYVKLPEGRAQVAPKSPEIPSRPSSFRALSPKSWPSMVKVSVKSLGKMDIGGHGWSWLGENLWKIDGKSMKTYENTIQFWGRSLTHLENYKNT